MCFFFIGGCQWSLLNLCNIVNAMQFQLLGVSPNMDGHSLVRLSRPFHQGDEICTTNMQINFTITFCKPPYDWLIKRVVKIHPLGVTNSLPCRAWWKFHQVEESCSLEWFFTTLVLQGVEKWIHQALQGDEILCETAYKRGVKLTKSAILVCRGVVDHNSHPPAGWPRVLWNDLLKPILPEALVMWQGINQWWVWLQIISSASLWYLSMDALPNLSFSK